MEQKTMSHLKCLFDPAVIRNIFPKGLLAL